ncbi:hypothetical protein [Prosthecobacter sp.]
MNSVFKVLMRMLAGLFGRKRPKHDTPKASVLVGFSQEPVPAGKCSEKRPNDQNDSQIDKPDDATSDFYSLIGTLTDLCDELKLPAGQAAHTPSAEQFRQMLINKMEIVDVLLIREPLWDALKQRAVKVASQDGSGIKVLSSVRTGIYYRRKIIRKEEVIISK